MSHLKHLLWFTPLALLQLDFMFEPDHYLSLLAYGLIIPAIIGFLIYLIFVLIIELRLYTGRSVGWKKLPIITVIAIMAVVTFGTNGSLVEPIVKKVPSWCRAYQIAYIDTIGDKQYALVHDGRGNESEYTFSSAYLNYSDEKGKGISDIRFRPMKFGWWEGYDQKWVQGSKENLIEMTRSNTQNQQEHEKTCSTIWTLLEQAEQGRPLASDEANVEDLVITPFDNEHYILGGFIWILVFSGLFIFIGRLRSPKELQQHNNANQRTT